jgi:hypothetical protein
MTREPTQNYTDQAKMRFQWATSDNDKFDRELDIYNLSQALELHDHADKRGLPVTRVGASSIVDTMYGSNSIPERAYQTGSVSTRALADNSVTDAKMNPKKVNRTGDTMTNTLRITHESQSKPNEGAIYFGQSDYYLMMSGNQWFWYNPSGGKFNIYGDVVILRTGAQSTGYLFLGSGGHWIGFDGTQWLLDSVPLMAIGVPVGGIIMMKTNQEVNNLGARWARDTDADGRFIMGAGTSFSRDFTENTQYGVNWTPMIPLSVSKGTLSVTIPGASATGSFLAQYNGAMNPNTASDGHGHNSTGVTGDPALGGTNTVWVPPAISRIFARRVS